MPQFVTVSVTVDQLSIPTPPADLEFRTVSLPSLGPFRFPRIEVDPVHVDIPDVTVDPFTITFPTVQPTTAEIDLGQTPTIPFPIVDLPSVAFDTVTIEVLGQEFSFPDPTTLRLVGGNVDTVQIGPFDLGTVDIPSVAVGSDKFRFGGVSIPTPDVDFDGLDLSLPDIPRFAPGPLSIPDGVVLRGSLSVPDPTAIDVDVTVDWTAVQRFVLAPVPDGLLSDPDQFVFDAAVRAVIGGLGAGVLLTLKDVLEAILNVAMSSETQERLRNRNRDR